MNRLQKLLTESDYLLMKKALHLYKDGVVEESTLLDTIATMISITQFETYK